MDLPNQDQQSHQQEDLPNQDQQSHQQEDSQNQAQQLTTHSKFMIPKPIMNFKNYKMVIGINMELKTTQSEVCSILGDAVIKAVTQAINAKSPYVGQWYYYGQAKVSVKVPNAQEIQNLVQTSQANDVPYVTIEYKGKLAAIACGPAPVEIVDKTTGHLKLL